MTRRSHLQLQRLETREVPSGNRLFATGEDNSSHVAVYEATGQLTLPTTFPTEPTTPPSPPTGPTFDGSGKLLVDFDVFPGFAGGTRVALGDVSGDGVEDLVVGAGPGGGAHVKVYDGADLLNKKITVIADFFAFDASFRGGVYVAVGQVDTGPGGQEIIVGAGA